MKTPETLRVIRDEHNALSGMLQSLSLLIRREPGDDPQRFFDTLEAMLFYIDEFPERLHHTKESDLLFPRVVKLAPQTAEAIARLEHDHAKGEPAVRELRTCCWPGNSLGSHVARHLSSSSPFIAIFTWSTCFSKKKRYCQSPSNACQRRTGPSSMQRLRPTVIH